MLPLHNSAISLKQDYYTRFFEKVKGFFKKIPVNRKNAEKCEVGDVCGQFTAAGFFGMRSVSRRADEESSG